MNCPRCNGTNYVKDGIVQGRQRYKCKDCNYRYTVTRKSDVKTEETRRLALDMYLEGIGFRTIGKVLKISYGTAYAWVKTWESKVKLPRREKPITEVNLDEMHTYVRSKKKDVGHGLLLIDLEKGTSILSVENTAEFCSNNS